MIEMNASNTTIAPDIEWVEEDTYIAEIEAWFDVDEKFHVDTTPDNTWLNIYAFYNPVKRTVYIECSLDTDDDVRDYMTYTPTPAEAEFLMVDIEKRFFHDYGMTCLEDLQQNWK